MNITVVGRIPSKKNSKSAFVIKGRAMIVGNPAYNKWHKGAMERVMAQVEGVKLPLESSRVTFTFFAPDARKGDLSNKWESVADLFVDCGIFSDDNWDVLGNVLMQYGGIDRDNPRAEVLIR